MSGRFIVAVLLPVLSSHCYLVVQFYSRYPWSNHTAGMAAARYSLGHRPTSRLGIPDFSVISRRHSYGKESGDSRIR
ncbi:hypothetical protein H4582DRAFT_1902797 [Lactarius indigo]|nr:hypothetical protein H4582DRAFT_1902797 [Lactarius indigo]